MVIAFGANRAGCLTCTATICAKQAKLSRIEIKKLMPLLKWYHSLAVSSMSDVHSMILERVAEVEGKEKR